MCRSLTPGDKGSVASLPASRPCARLRFRLYALAPSGAGAGGWGFGAVPASLWPAPGGPSAAPCGGGVVAPVGRCRFLWGVCRGFFLSGWFPVSGLVPWRAGRAAVRALVASAGRVGAGCWCAALARSAVGAVVLRCRGGGRLRVGCVGFGVRVGVVGLGRVPAGRSAVRRWRVRRLGAGGRPAVAAAGRSRRVARAGGLGGRLVVSLPPLPLLVARVGGCRWRWLVRGGARCLAVRCPSRAVAALVCRRARAFGLPPVRAGRRGLLVLLPSARVAPLSRRSRSFAGPAACSAPASVSPRQRSLF